VLLVQESMGDFILCARLEVVDAVLHELVALVGDQQPLSNSQGVTFQLHVYMFQQPHELVALVGDQQPLSIRSTYHAPYG